MLRFMDKDISTLLGEIKEAKCWSEPRLATELGTSQPTVHRILKGQSECKVSTYKAIESLHKLIFPARRTRSPGKASPRPP